MLCSTKIKHVSELLNAEMPLPHLLQRYILRWEGEFPSIEWLEGHLGAYLMMPARGERFLALGWCAQFSPWCSEDLRLWLNELNKRLRDVGEGEALNLPLRAFGNFAFSASIPNPEMPPRFGLPVLLWSEERGGRWLTFYHWAQHPQDALTNDQLQARLTTLVRQMGLVIEFRVAKNNTNSAGISIAISANSTGIGIAASKNSVSLDIAASTNSVTLGITAGTNSTGRSIADSKRNSNGNGHCNEHRNANADESHHGEERADRREGRVPGGKVIIPAVWQGQFPRLWERYRTGDLQIFPLPAFAEWKAQIVTLQEAMRRGEVEKVVLARTLHLQQQERWRPEAVFQALWRAYPESHLFFFRFEDERTFLGATPERLVRVENGQLETMALAGSLPRGADAQEDAILTQRLLTDPRLRLEHQIVVESICRRLEPLAQHIQLSEVRPFLLPNVQHLQVQIRGQLAAEYDVLDAIDAFHPTAALGGEPRQAALGWIERLEPFERGWYGAPFGWVDAKGNGDFYVALRCGLLRGKEARLFAGAGILPQSDPQAEWDETALKFRPMLQALDASL